MSREEELEARLNSIIEYCKPHQEYMWSKFIIALATNSDEWRDDNADKEV